MTTKFTPGPWTVLRTPTEYEGQQAKSFVAAVPYEGHPYFSRTRFFDIAGDEDYPTKEADLRLIAAAPDLHQSCAELLAAFQAVEPNAVRAQIMLRAQEALFKAVES